MKKQIVFIASLALFIVAFGNVGLYWHTHPFISGTYFVFTAIIFYVIFLEFREHVSPAAAPVATAALRVAESQPANKPIAASPAGPVATSPASLPDAINTVLSVTSPTVTSPAPIKYSTTPETPAASAKPSIPSIHDAIIGKRRLD